MNSLDLLNDVDNFSTRECSAIERFNFNSKLKSINLLDLLLPHFKNGPCIHVNTASSIDKLKDISSLSSII